ncbi:MAG TPA: beta-N-acetylhexosaminidase [Polyangiaceae bacterium]
MNPRAVGPLVLGGFDGSSLPERFARALAEGRRGGCILFKRNVGGGPAQVAALCQAARAAAPGPVFVGVDQEGGRVARLGAPLLVVPAMRTVASWGDEGFAERIARRVGVELAALGFNIAFAPVLDVNTRADNPVIGDRAFGDDPDTCARFGAAWIRGLQGAGLLACGKHFPGHGDTAKDSHFDLPVVDGPRARLDEVELVPFRAAVAAGVASMMTAHVVYPAIDPERPATLSPAVCTELRAAMGFHGVLVSDDLEMKAVAARWPVEDAAVLSVAAGCDALLVCSSEDLQDRAEAALAREAAASPAFRARCHEAAGRVAAALGRVGALPEGGAFAAVIGGPESQAVARDVAARLEARPG